MAIDMKDAEKADFARPKRTSPAEVEEVVPATSDPSTEAQADQLAVELVDHIVSDADKSGILVTERGLTIYLRKVNRNVIADAWAKVPDPKVPTWADPDKSDPAQGIIHETENPNDPAYIQALQDAQMQRARIAGTVNIALGVRGVDGIEAAGLVHWDDDSWLDYIEYTDLEIPKAGKVRMVSWMRYYALTNTDLGNLSLAVSVFSNSALREADVEIAESSFRC